MTRSTDGIEQMLIDGQWRLAEAGAALELVDPSTGLAWASVANGSPVDADRAVASARAAFDVGPWRSMPAAKRAALINRLADLVEADLDHLAALDARNVGMPLMLARAMLPGAVAELRYNAGWCERIHGETVRVDTRTGEYLGRASG